MKKNIKKLLYAFPIILSSSSLVATISCSSSSNDSKQESNEKIDKLELNTKLRGNVYYIEYKSSIPNESVIKTRNRFNEYINKYVDDIKQKNNLNSIIIPEQNGSKLLRNPNQISGYPESFESKMNLDGQLKTITWKFLETKSNLDLGILSQKGQDAKSQEAALNLEEVNNYITITYKAYLDDKTFFNLKDIEFRVEAPRTTINPILSKLPTTYDKTKFKPAFDWESKSAKKVDYFRAKIVRVKDGDTFDVIALENKENVSNVSVVKDKQYTIRLAGIDTPEKAVGSGNNVVTSSPFEYAFALMPTHFAESLFKNSEEYKNDVYVGFVTDFDAYGRVTADIFFGDKHQFSYNNEVVRAGFTLPYANDAWETAMRSETLENSYIKSIYPEMYKSFNEAIKNNNGFFKYFDRPLDVTKYIYNIKINNKWHPFYGEKSDKNSKNIGDYIDK
ncbi:hypothetical protein JXZ92_00125 [Mycoplasma sp. CSL10137]|uniref:thermonuclease family protein n=1 Tax=Mycoplasma sp. CSL10137 TaxID=2813824 RepID=UPI00197B1F67|nr:hypothetical protein [Mycoplasma sp. CSL10137]MBN4083228.1 hypothetical protein [Mycoplasma sp. CSL10137]